MRDLLYKNLTSLDKRRRIITTTETIDKEGVHSIVRRHFTCLVKSIKSADLYKPKSYLRVLKRRDTKQKTENFFCKMKGSILAIKKGNLLLVEFVHTLRIQLSASPKLSEQIG